ncbi:broad-complex core protein isoforms 1/2/3/4/5 [Onthophagus taurus]|uniref:broad-complex core protein isoforms 1/2/3/4/5 n=1 Tax=Onthophagus taurus TaxID=166361 RepID=UPI000C20499D|nr:broad-complex core protein isoforms 1/2/3/4/5 [Onthophagus taurus]XP_022908225.1 broad-complex core protein isoforms 1/2/3/4/5 [Onthophagus taurus]
MGSVTQQFCLRWNNHQSNLLSVFDELLQNEAFTDVTLVCDGGNPIKCHRMVLAACSPYFQNLFTDLPCKHPVVVLKDVKFIEIKAILEYMYRGEVNVAQDQLAALLKVAEALKVKGLVEENRDGRTATSNNSLRMDDDIGHDHHHHSPNSGITTTSIPSTVHSSSNNNNNSPPHSTNGNYAKNPYSLYGKAPSMERNRIGMPIWTLPGLPMPHPPPVQHQNPPHPAATMLGYESPDLPPMKRKKFSSMMMNRDTPILRTVLGQGQQLADSSQPVSLVCHEQENSQHSLNEERNERIIKNEPSEDAQSPYTDLSITNDEEKMKMAIPSTSPQSYSSTDIHGISSGIATYVPTQKPEWKRYKQYTRNDIMSAIEAVRNGMSALQAARKYGVPSRTLYDKVKKLGITTSRPFKRGSNGSSACFPYGLSGTNSPYESDDHHNHNSLLEASSFLQHALDGRPNEERDALAAMAAAAVAHHAAAASGQSTPPNHGIGARSPSPSPIMVKYLRQNSLTPSPAPGSDNHHSETNGSSEREREDEDEVEDLSIGRKQVIVPPMNNQVSTIIKKEDVLKEFKEDVRREVSVDDAE